jgi:hypothetical protein
MLQCCTRMFASVCSHYFICFLDICCKCVYLDIAYVSHICCKCFIWMLRMFVMIFKYFWMFLQVVQIHVSSVSSIFQTYVTSAASGCFKVDQDTAHVARAPMARERWPTTGFPSSRGAPRLVLYSPFPSLPSISTWQFEPDKGDVRGGGGLMSRRRWWPQVGRR